MKKFLVSFVFVLALGFLNHGIVFAESVFKTPEEILAAKDWITKENTDALAKEKTAAELRVSTAETAQNNVNQVSLWKEEALRTSDTDKNTALNTQITKAEAKQAALEDAATQAANEEIKLQKDNQQIKTDYNKLDVIVKNNTEKAALSKQIADIKIQLNNPALSEEKKKELLAQQTSLEADSEVFSKSNICVAKSDNNCPDLKAAQLVATQANNAMLNLQREALAKQSFNLTNLGIHIGASKTIEGVIGNIIQFLARMIGIFAIFSIMIGGLMMIISSGDEGLQDKGKSLLIYGIIAVVIVLSAWVIVSTITQIIYGLGK